MIDAPPEAGLLLPPLLLALALLSGLALGGAGPWPVGLRRAPVLALLLIALLIRLWVVPAWQRHTFDGHEAEYWDIFRGERPMSRGGTMLYPAMQGLWWSLGRILPADPHMPVLISVLVALLGVLAWTGALGRLVGPRAGLLGGLLVALHPVHAAWSSSAYNVILPWSLGALALLGASGPGGGGQEAGAPLPPGAGREGLGRGLVVGAALGLVALLRLDALSWSLVVLPLALLGLRRLPPRRLAGFLAGLALTWLVAALGLGPLLAGGELPGAGEREAAFRANLLFFAPYAPLDGPPAALALLLALPFAARAAPLPTALFVLMALGNHLLMATFDDFGDRHALLALPLFAFLAATAAGRSRWRLAWLPLGLVLIQEASGLWAMNQEFFATDRRFLAEGERPPWSELPRYRLDQVGTALAPRGRCALVAEDPRVAADPPLSHFNLLDPVEAEALRAEDGCLRWCADKQDWQWSSRGVRDRARRLHHLYAVQPVARVIDEEQGFLCLAWQVGARRR